jgi:hypothetical protein
MLTLNAKKNLWMRGSFVLFFKKINSRVTIMLLEEEKNILA